MKKIILVLAVTHVIVTLSCSPKIADNKGWKNDPRDSIPYDVAKKSIELYQTAVKKNPDLPVLFINLSSRIIRNLTSTNAGYDAIRIFPACVNTNGKDSSYLIIEIYNKIEGNRYYDISNFYTPQDLLSPEMRNQPVLCPEPQLCPVDIRQ